MLLENKTAVIYGAAGGIGSAVARDFAQEGARLFLAGRTFAKVEALAKDVGGRAAAAQVDALDERAVEQHAAAVVAQAGRIDICFNAIGMEDVQGMTLADMPTADVLRPIIKGATTHLLTARAVARHMAKAGAGVILTITAGPPESIGHIGGFGAACGAIEGLWRTLAAELGPHGVRLVCIRSAGSPDTPDVQETFRLHAQATGVTLEGFTESVGNGALLGRLPSVAEVAGVVTMMASDRASAMTGTFVHVTCGSPVE